MNLPPLVWLAEIRRRRQQEGGEGGRLRGFEGGRRADIGVIGISIQ